MTKVALVHSPLVGASMWDAVAGNLRERGNEAIVVSLADDLRDPSFWVAAARRVHTVPADVVILYSASGFLAPTIAPDRPIVFVDAQLPRTEAASWWSAAPADLTTRLGRLIVGDTVAPFWQWWGDEIMSAQIPDRSAREQFQQDCPSIPLTLLHSPLPVGELPRRAAFARLSQGYEDGLRTARDQGWPTTTLEGPHLMPVSDPAAVGGAVFELVAALAD